MPPILFTLFCVFVIAPALLLVLFILRMWILFHNTSKQFVRKSGKEKQDQDLPAVIPGPGPFYLFKFIAHRLFAKEQLQMSDFLYQELEKVGAMKCGLGNVSYFGRCLVHVCDPDVAKQVFLSGKFPKINIAEKSGSHSVIKRFLGASNLVFVEGEQWKKIRTMLNPAFSRVDLFHDQFMVKIDKAISYMKSEQESRGFVMPCRWMNRLAFDILGTAIMGTDFNTLEISEERSEFMKSYSFLLSQVNNFLHMLIPFYTRLPLPSNKRIDDSVKALNKIVTNLLNDAKERIKKRDQGFDEGNVGDVSVIEMMLESENQLTLEELRDQIVVFMVAGHETTATSLAFALYILGKHPNVQERLIQEVDCTIGRAETPTCQHLEQMTYLRNFVNEVLRVYPPTALLSPRMANQDTELNGYRIPKGTGIQVLITALHRNPKVWDKPNDFDPDNFLNCKKPFSYAPFSHGPRTCIGNTFSLMEQKLFIARLLQRYKVELPDPSYIVKLDPANLDTLFKVEQEMKILFKPRL